MRTNLTDKTKFGKVRATILTFVHLMIISGCALAQVDFTDDVAGVTNPIIVQSASCDNTIGNTNPDFLNKYRRVDYWSPYVATTKVIKVAIHVFTGPTGSGTMQNNASDIAKIQQEMSWVNDIYRNNCPPSDPIAGVVELPSTYIQFDWDNRIYFYDNTTYWQDIDNVSAWESYISGIDPSRLDYLEIYFVGTAPPPKSSATYPKYFGTYSTPNGLNGNSWMRKTSNGGGNGPDYAASLTIAHELGHCMDLFHTYEASCCHEICDPNHTDYLPDLFGPTPPVNCWHEGGWSCEPTDPLHACTNNIMGGTYNACYFSPLQIAKMHRACYIKSVRRYVKDCPISTLPFIITQNETWDFDIRMYQNIEVNSGATLTVKCNIHMPEGCKIIVHGGGTLVIDGGQLDGSCANMWAGVEVEENGSITTMNSALIQDAQYGIFAHTKTILNIDNTTFNRNYVGIFVPDSPIDANFITGYITNSIFQCDAPLHGGYPNQYPLVGITTFAGIQMSDVAFVIDGGAGTNVFTDLNIGIYGKRSTLSVLNCMFNNIQMDFNYYATGIPFCGSGIYVAGGHGYQTLTQKGFGYSASSTVSFKNCLYGIYADRMNTVITKNNMTLVKYGVRIHHSNYRNTLITLNRLDCDYYGVYAVFNDGANHLNIGGNTILIGYNTSYTVGNASGIYINEISHINNNTKISSNNIQIQNGRNGIFINNVDYAGIGSNIIGLNKPTDNRFGIIAQGSQHVGLTCNKVANQGIGTYLWERSIYISASLYSTLACNETKKTYQGINFNGNCAGADLKGNDIWDHNNGLICGSSAVLGSEWDKGNEWLGTYSNYGAIHQGNAFLSQFGTNGTTPFTPPTFMPASWFLSSSGTPFNCGTSGICNIIPVQSIKADNIDLEIALDHFNTPEFNRQTTNSARRYLFEKLEKDSSLLKSDQAFINFYDSTAITNIAKFQKVKDGNDILFNIPEESLLKLDKYSAYIDTAMMAIEANDILLSSDTLSATQREELINSNISLQETAFNLTAANGDLISSLEDIKANNVTSLSAINENIISKEIYESNEQIVNEIYFKTIAIGNLKFTDDDKSKLFSIAQQCPYAGGIAVYRARGIYELIDEKMTYDDDSFCVDPNKSFRRSNTFANQSQSIAEYIYMYPNPTTDKVTVNYSLGINTTAQLVIQNLVGEVVTSYALNSSTNETVLDVSTLKAGIYLYTLRTTNGYIQNGKLVIAK